MVPEAFRENVANQLKFTHLDDVEIVCRLQAEVYKEKAEMCRSLRLVDLGADALDIALSALENYPILESLEIVHCELSHKLPLLLKVVEEKKLTQLHLQHNELFEEGPCQVIEALRTNTTLTELNLSHMRLDGDMVIALAKKRTLERLNIAGAKFEIAEDCAFALLEALRVRRVKAQLQLDLTGSDLGKAAVALAKAVRAGEVKGTVTHPVVEFLVLLQDGKFKELEEAQKLELNLHNGCRSRESQERFRELFPEPLCRTLPKLPLRELRLDLSSHGNAFGDDGARALAAGLQHQKELQRLRLGLSVNRIGDEGAKALASALRELTELKELTLILYDNHIGDAGATAVAGSLRALRQLAALTIDLDKNAVGDAGATSVVESLGELQQLAKLFVELQNNQLGEEEWKKLLPAFDALPVANKQIQL